MCGICGTLSLNVNKTHVSGVERMMEKLSSRGPDAMGLFRQDNIALGHRRLKIIDLSERAQQPMVDNNLGLTIVYNGAIYNYKKLRSQLRDKGYQFFSTGDTEVILKAYHAWGKDCLNHLNGMFAFAIWHRDSKELFLARDRLGIKPVYYAVNSDSFSFASSLPALLTQKDIDTDIDPSALNYYMNFHSVVPAPFTILKGINKLPPATSLLIKSDGTISVEKYWDLEFKSKKEELKYSFEDWKALLLNKLRTAVKRRLTADVPVGVLLSGGLDSSLVVGLLAETGQKNINTFSIGFESINGEEGDEFEYSNCIADHFDTVHHRISAGSQLVLSNLDDCVRAMAEPMVSHDCIGFYLLSRDVAKFVKVVQSGQGADEVFGGYHWYPPLMDSRNIIKDYRNIFFDRTPLEYTRTVHPRFIHDDDSYNFIHSHFSKIESANAVDKALHVDTTVMLIDDPVKRVDNMTMAFGLEARVPFLDHELVEFAARIPAEFKINNGGKFILKEAARDIIPSKAIDRPKGYFPVPALKYFRGEYLDLVHDILHSEKAVSRGLFNQTYVDQLFNNPDDHITPLRCSKLWQLALLEYWLSVHLE
ncbi:MAG: N-acetylglutaminylglutamine amidotransferase [Desulfobacterales bacterium]|nr:N-acetylglutaminylglutamine amidotransferase [Desulfobacterales bacterium]